jgi:hypothetical protein
MCFEHDDAPKCAVSWTTIFWTHGTAVGVHLSGLHTILMSLCDVSWWVRIRENVYATEVPNSEDIINRILVAATHHPWRVIRARGSSWCRSPSRRRNSEELSAVLIVARMWRLYNTGIGLTTGFIRSHSVTHNYSVYTLQFTMFTITLAESFHCVFIGCLSSYATGSVHLQNQPATLQLFTHTLNGLDVTLDWTTRLALQDWTDWCSNTDWLGSPARFI